MTVFCTPVGFLWQPSSLEVLPQSANAGVFLLGSGLPKSQNTLAPWGCWLSGWRQIWVLLHTQADQDMERGTSGCSRKQVQKAQVS